jgi:uncharacterized protein (DUF2062 family)
MKPDTGRLFRYYILRIKRLRGDPGYLARGIGFGIFMGVLPLVPIQTMLLIPLSVAFRVSTIAAIVAATIVSNPLTFLPQYYITWRTGDLLLPGRISWPHLQQALVTIENEGLLDGMISFSHLGLKAIMVILTGGAIIGVPMGLISYFISLYFFRAVQKKRAEKHKLNIT